MKIFKPLTWGLLLFSYIVFGQLKNTDFRKLSYSDLSDSFFDNEENTTKQLFYASLYLKKAIVEKKDIEIATAYDFFSMVYAPIDSKKALFYIDKSIYYSKGKNDSFYPMNSYWNKVVILANQDQVEEAIDNLKKAEELAKKNNNSFYFAIKLNLGKIKSERLGEVKEAIKIYRECHNFYKKEVNKRTFSNFYRQTLFSMADAHKTLKNTDSASFYNRLGYTNSKQNNDEYFKNFFALNEGANLIVKGKYLVAIDSLNKVFPYIRQKADFLNVMATYYYYGKAYEGMGNDRLAVVNYKKIDSIYQKRKKIMPEIVHGYPFLIEYYKTKGIKEQQLHYTTTYMEIEHDFQKKYKQFYSSIIKKYEIPNLLADKTKQIDTITLLLRVVLFCLLIVSLIAFYQFYKRRVYKARFDKIIDDIDIKRKQNLNYSTSFQNDEIDYDMGFIDENSTATTNTIQNHEENTTKEVNDLNISKELVKELIERLSVFEREKHYLKSGITIQNLAKDYGTNVKYLSKVVNYFKGRSFIQYVNDLRIDYAVKSLKEDKMKRKYTMHALSVEFGFNNSESFSTAFYKKTGIKPSFFIKELEKLKVEKSLIISNL